MFAENFKAIGQGVQDLSSGNQKFKMAKKKKKKKKQTKTIGFPFFKRDA